MRPCTDPMPGLAAAHLLRLPKAPARRRSSTVEHPPCKREVAGSSPAAGTIGRRLAEPPIRPIRAVSPGAGRSLFGSPFSEWCFLVAPSRNSEEKEGLGKYVMRPEEAKAPVAGPSGQEEAAIASAFLQAAPFRRVAVARTCRPCLSLQPPPRPGRRVGLHLPRVLRAAAADRPERRAGRRRVRLLQHAVPPGPGHAGRSAAGGVRQGQGELSRRDLRRLQGQSPRAAR